MQIRFEWIIVEVCPKAAFLCCRKTDPCLADERKQISSWLLANDPWKKGSQNIGRPQTTPEQRLTFYIFVFVVLEPPGEDFSITASRKLDFNGFNKAATRARDEKTFFSSTQGVGEINLRTFMYASSHVLMVCFPSPYTLVESYSRHVMRLQIFIHITTFQTESSGATRAARWKARRH